MKTSGSRSGNAIGRTRRRLLPSACAVLLSALLACTFPAAAYGEDTAAGDGGTEAGAQAASFATGMFLDTKESEWYVKNSSLDYAVDNQMMTGFQDGEDAGCFLPYGNATRGQVVTILHRVAGEPAPASKDSRFTDLARGKYYYSAVVWAAEKGIVSGYDGTTLFDPEGLVTREQLAKMFAEYANKVDGYPIGTDCKALDAIKESSKVSPWARNYMGWAVDKGLLSGIERNGVRYLAPGDKAWRASVATMAMVLHRDVLNMPYSGTTQSQREQTVLKDMKAEVKKDGHTWTVQLRKAERGADGPAARSFRMILTLDQDLETARASLKTDEQYRTGYMNLCSQLLQIGSDFARHSNEAGAKLPVWTELVSKDNKVLYKGFNGSVRYQRFVFN